LGQTNLEKLQAGQFWCRSCGAAHRGMFDLVSIAPTGWPGRRDYEPIGALRLDGDFLSEDFAVFEGRYFLVRCVLNLPVAGLPRPFGFGCWALLSKADFLAYWDDFDNPEPKSLEPWAGLLANDLAPYPAGTNLDCLVQVQPDRKRPTVLLLDDGHPLGRAQRDGITVDHLLSIYRANGHDIG
jgi:hypothetical protein